MTNRLKSTGLALPLIAFIVITFIVPLGSMFALSMHDSTVADTFPKTADLLSEWDGVDIPTDSVFAVLGDEMVVARQNRTLGKTVTRINRVRQGSRSLFNKTARRLEKSEAIQTADSFFEIDERWANVGLWRDLRNATARFTPRHYLQALDLKLDDAGSITAVDEKQKIYVPLFLRTFKVSIVVTLLCLLIGYPMAYVMAHAKPRVARILVVMVLIPFWTSLLVRTTSWIVLLQHQGVINDILVYLGVIDDANRFTMIYNMIGTYVAMTHVLLPFMILPLYSVMLSIPPTYVRAAASLGANPLQAFTRVYWMLSLPGVAAGSLLVFILSIGYYITPALVGGSDGQLISNMIAYHLQTTLNWGLAAALATILLVLTYILYAVYDRLVGIDRMRFG